MHFSTGILYRRSSFNSGVSMRYEFDFTKEINPRLLAGGEIHIFPPPSNFVFSIQGGMWIQETRTEGYGGIGIGMIF
jgi:hypothetical protein